MSAVYESSAWSDDTMNVNSRPSIGEYDGFYNLSIEDVRVLGLVEANVLRTSPRLTPLLDDDRYRFMKGVAECVKRLGLSVSLPIINEAVVNQPDLLLIQSIDRSVGLEWRDATKITPTIVEGIRSFLRAHFAEWRVVLFGITPDSRITIYADAIRFEQTINGDTIEDKLAMAVATELAERNATIGEGDRQLALVKKQFGSRLDQRARETSPVILFRFSTCRGDTSKNVVWLYHCGDSYDSVKFVGQIYGYGTTFEIASDHSFHELYDGPDDRLGFLVEVVFKSENIGARMPVTDGKEVWVLDVPLN